MSSELQWDLFTDQFNTLVRMVHDFKSLEINLNDYIKQKNLGLFEKKDFKIETDPNTVLCQIIGTLNKQVLRALLHEKYLHNLSYKLLNCMSSALANIQIIIKHPELDTSSLEKYYSCIAQVNILGSEMEGKYLDYLSFNTLKNSNKREIIVALAAEVQLLKYLLNEKKEDP